MKRVPGIRKSGRSFVSERVTCGRSRSVCTGDSSWTGRVASASGNFRKIARHGFVHSFDCKTLNLFLEYSSSKPIPTPREYRENQKKLRAGAEAHNLRPFIRFELRPQARGSHRKSVCKAGFQKVLNFHICSSRNGAGDCKRSYPREDFFAVSA